MDQTIAEIKDDKNNQYLKFGNNFHRERFKLYNTVLVKTVLNNWCYGYNSHAVLNGDYPIKVFFKHYMLS